MPTYPNGVAAPNPGDPIPADGASAWQMVASTADAALADRPTRAQVDALLAPIEAGANLPQRNTVTGENLDAALASQVIRHSSSVTGVQNLPPWGTGYSSDSVTLIHVINTEGNPYAAQVAYRYGAVPEMAWRVSRNTTGLWQAWQMVRAKDVHLDDAWARHGDLMSRARARRGGSIGTGGVPAVAFRFDHHTGPWAAKVLPLLEERGIPWAQIINPANMGTGDDTMTYAELQDAALRSGGEIWNHGGNHGDALYPLEAHREIPDALTALQNGVPRLAVEGWAPPGLADGAYMGAAPFKTTEQNTGTYTGQLIIRNHAFVAGYADGVYRTLDPNIQPIGAPHVTMDKAYAAQVGRMFDGLGSDGAAFMLHPNYLDEPGYMTTADLVTILDDVVARRDAGALKVLTYSGLWLADAASNRRDDLMAGQAGEQAGTWSGSLDLYRRENRAGSVREASCLVAGGSSVTFTLTVGAETFTQTRPVPSGTGWRRVVAPFTIPADATGTVTLTIDSGTSGQTSQALASI